MPSAARGYNLSRTTKMEYGKLNQKNQRVNVDHFSMVPRADIPRSTFVTQHTHKTTFDGGKLIPIYISEALPGDATKGHVTLFIRMGTLLFPLMDHVTFETFFFFVPWRIIWENSRKFFGERDNPTDSISYTIPQVGLVDGAAPFSLADYMGVPASSTQYGGRTLQVNSLPFRAYAKIYNEWFRDQNLQASVPCPIGDGPDIDTIADVNAIRNRNKKHDYFTSALPWPLKNNAGINLPLNGLAPVLGIGVTGATPPTADGSNYYQTGPIVNAFPFTYDGAQIFVRADSANPGNDSAPQIYADLSQASGATIAALRLAVQTQRFLERDARSGTRYTELLKAHFGVMPEDARLQRPEYIGGGKSTMQTNAIPQTSQTGTTPLGALAASAVVTGQHNFTYNATEHGYIIGLIHVDAELTYQQGLHRMWTRQTRYDIYWPVFAHLSEQAIRNDEIYAQANTTDDDTFGYQERWAEYRHKPSRISGAFRSGNGVVDIDEWHSAQVFGTLPTLSSAFMVSNPPFARNLAAGLLAEHQQFLADMLFEVKETRPMPKYSVPGGMDRF